MAKRPDRNCVVPPSGHLETETTPELAVLRIKQRKRGWVPIPRALIDDARLQFDTRAVANWLIAKPDGWQIRLVALPYLLQQRAGPGERMGRDRVRRMLRELENAGYLTRARSKKADGRWAWRVELSDAPMPSHRSPTMDGSGVDLLNTLNHSILDKLIPTTTQAAAPEKAVVVVPVMEVRYPQILQGECLKSARKLIEACSPEQRQAVLDEIGATHVRGKVHSPLGLLRSLVDRVKRGEFSPNYSLSVDRNSSSKFRPPVHSGQPLTDTRTASKGPVPVSEIAPRLLADWREKWKPDGG